MGKDKCNSAFKVILIAFVLQLIDDNETQIEKHGMVISGIDLALSLHFEAIPLILVCTGCDCVSRAKS